MTTHEVTAAAVKVSIGGAGGNRVAVILRRGDVLPAGVDEEQVERLIDRDLITEIPEGAEEVFEGPSEEWTVKQLDEYAAANDIALGDAKSKADKLAVILAAVAE